MNDMSGEFRVEPKARLKGLRVLSPGEEMLATTRRGLLQPISTARGSLAARITLAAVGVVTLLLVLAASLVVAMIQLTGQIDRDRVQTSAALASAELSASIAESRYHAARFAVTGERDEIEATAATLDRAKQRLAATKDAAVDVDAQAHEQIEWLQVQVEGFESEIKALEFSVKTHGPSDGSRGLASAIGLSGEQLAAQARDVEAQLNAAALQSRERLDATGRSLALTIFSLLAVCVAIALLGARFVSRTTAGSIRQITRAMTRLAAGDRAIVIPGTERGDELGEMARALTVFRAGAEELAAIREREAESARGELAERDERTALMRDVATRFERMVGEVVGGVAAASGQLQRTAGTMASSAGESAKLAESVASGMSGTLSGMTAASAATDQFAMSIGEISQQAASSASVAKEARASAQEADLTIGALADSVGRIGEIVDMIHSIANRTTLLSLNASIEAARSGEAGRGFAVVAAEIKELAGQTGKATDQVSEHIRAIQASTGDSVEALRRIGMQVREMESGALAIAQAVDEQTMASRDLAQNLAMAASGAEEIGANVEQVSVLAQSTGTAATHVLSASEELHRQAATLRTQVQDFLGYVRAA